MTKVDAVIRLKEQPFKIIEWFTQNFNHEIGALGVGQIENGELVVEKLVFPKQIVNSAHVHFKPEDWASIVMELTPEELGRIVFYWHKHPDGCSTHSQGDEDDTIDVFMSDEAARPFFGFLVTSRIKGGGMNYDARIELREPVLVSITGARMLTDQDREIEKVCKKIVEEKVTIGHASARDQPGHPAAHKKQEISIVEYVGKKPTTAKELEESDIIFDVTNNNGCVKVRISPFFDDYFYHILHDQLDDKFRSVTSRHASYYNEYIIQPKKKQFKTIYDTYKQVAASMFETKAGAGNEGIEAVIAEANQEAIAESITDEFPNYEDTVKGVKHLMGEAEKEMSPHTQHDFKGTQNK